MSGISTFQNINFYSRKVINNEVSQNEKKHWSPQRVINFIIAQFHFRSTVINIFITTGTNLNYWIKTVLGFGQLFPKIHPRIFILGGSTYNTYISNDKVRLSLTPSQMEAFQQIKHAPTHAPVLTPPDFSKPFEVVSDASLLGTGAVLMQDNKPVAYTSSKFIPAARNYTTGEQELLGVFKALRFWVLRVRRRLEACHVVLLFKALKEWRCYLEGSKTTLVTDHNPLVHLQSQPSLSPSG